MIRLAVIFLLALQSCDTINLFERTEAIPGHTWKSSFKPSFSFNIEDTASPYQIYIIFRHTGEYNYNNVWLNLYTQPPGDTVQKVQYELPLASKEKGWLGSAMGDIYEHRISITPSGQNLYFRRSGNYKFTLEHIMREDPLQKVLDVGIRLEKK